MEPHDGTGNDASPQAPPRPRRTSMEEDLYYRELMTQRPARPPCYNFAVQQQQQQQQQNHPWPGGPGHYPPEDPSPEQLPAYSCDVHLEGVFMRKMEIEDTSRRAELRNWQMVYVVLHGTALNIYQVKKDRGWWTRTDGPNVSPDNPPWIKKATLEKSYGLLHADAGIAADYRKRRYVLRVRAEADQFLLSCVELVTFVEWLDKLFAAISVAPPIDERDFPRDQSIPRAQRVRWLRRQQQLQAQDASAGSEPLDPRRQSVASMVADTQAIDGSSGGPEQAARVLELPIRGVSGPPSGGESSDIPPPQVPERRSAVPAPNDAVDPETGKWTPPHGWTATHDYLYAKLCYSVLLFKSPRKSNYIVTKGKQWYVDWVTGRTFRVLPPAYGELDLGPWQTVMPENRLI